MSSDDQQDSRDPNVDTFDHIGARGSAPAPIFVGGLTGQALVEELRGAALRLRQRGIGEEWAGYLSSVATRAADVLEAAAVTPPVRLPAPADSLEARIRRELADVEGCTHELCSMADTIAEAKIAAVLRRILGT